MIDRFSVLILRERGKNSLRLDAASAARADDWEIRYCAASAASVHQRSRTVVWLNARENAGLSRASDARADPFDDERVEAISPRLPANPLRRVQREGQSFSKAAVTRQASL